MVQYIGNTIGLVGYRFGVMWGFVCGVDWVRGLPRPFGRWSGAEAAKGPVADPGGRMGWKLKVSVWIWPRSKLANQSSKRSSWQSPKPTSQPAKQDEIGNHSPLNLIMPEF